MTEKEGPQIKHIDMAVAKFTANNKTYYIQSKLSLNRYIEYLKLSNEIAFNTNFDGMFATLKKIWDAASHGNDLIEANHKARELSYNQMNSISEFTSGKHPAILRFCALFINSDGEDISKFDDIATDSKINDWIEEGLAIDDFFFLAANFIPSFRDAYRTMTDKDGNVSEEISEKKPPTKDSTTKTSTNKSSHENKSS